MGIFILSVKTAKKIAFCKNPAKGSVLTDNPVHKRRCPHPKQEGCANGADEKPFQNGKG